MEEHPRLFNKLYVSMVRVGEEAGVLPEGDDGSGGFARARGRSARRSDGGGFVSGFCARFRDFHRGDSADGGVAAAVQNAAGDAADSAVADVDLVAGERISCSTYWLPVARGVVARDVLDSLVCANTKGALAWDRLKLRIPVMGSVFRSAALGRFARTLGTLVKSGVSLLPALKIVENTIGNLMLAQIDRAGFRRDARRRFAGDALCASWDFSQNGHANDQRRRGDRQAR